MSLKSFYKRMPNEIKYPIQYLYRYIPKRVLKGSRYVNEYYRFKKLLSETDKFSEEKLKKLKLQKLKEIINYANENSEYYKRLFKENNIDLNNITNYEEYRKIPFLTKELVRKNNKEILCKKEFNDNYIEEITTGGTTGVPMTFYMNKLEWARENAFIDHIFERVGYKKGMKTAILRGNPVKVVKDKNIFWEKKVHFNEEVFSTFHLTNKNIPFYLEELKIFKPVCIKAYPSSLFILASYINQNNLSSDFNFIKNIILASENIFKSQRDEFKSAFRNSKIFSFYGHTEHGCLAAECEESDYYHIQDEYGFIEILDDNGNEVNEEDGIGEIVCTSFINKDFPFIRYRTGDMAVVTNTKCKCGRNYRLIKRIEGRKQDFFIDKYNNKISFIYQDVPLWEIKEYINAYQYIQDEPGKVQLNIERRKDIDDKLIEKVKEVFKKYYNDFEINIDFVNNIERTKRGKFKYLVQNVD